MSAIVVALSLVGAIALGVPLQGRQLSHSGLRLIQAEVHGEFVYVLARVTVDPAHPTKDQSSGPLLLRCHLANLTEGTSKIELFDFLMPGLKFHWSMTGRSFWAENPQGANGIYRIPKSDFPPPNCKCELDEYREKYAIKWSNLGLPRPGAVSTARGGNIGFVTEYPFEIWSHLMPVGHDTGLYFLRRESDPENPEERGPDMVEVFHGRVEKIKEGEFAGDTWFNWKKVESFPAEFREHFQVRAKGDDYYIITESGQVLLARKPEKGKQRKLEIVWGKDRPPVTSILTDNDTDEVYLFGKPKDKQGKPFFFKLSPKPEPTEFDAAVFARGPVDEPLRTAFGMARAAGLAKEPKRERVPAPRP